MLFGIFMSASKILESKDNLEMSTVDTFHGITSKRSTSTMP
jgi:hypothetical protein